MWEHSLGQGVILYARRMYRTGFVCMNVFVDTAALAFCLVRRTNHAGPGTTFMQYASVGILTHELGHNLGMLHSRAPCSEYGDRTGEMGSGNYVLRGRTCSLHAQRLGSGLGRACSFHAQRLGLGLEIACSLHAQRLGLGLGRACSLLAHCLG